MGHNSTAKSSKNSDKIRDRSRSPRKKDHGSGSSSHSRSYGGHRSSKDKGGTHTSSNTKSIDIQKGIEAAKNRLKTSLKSAISELSEDALNVEEKYGSSHQLQQISKSTEGTSVNINILDSVNRQI